MRIIVTILSALCVAPHSILWNGTVSFPSYSEAIMALASALS